MSYFAPDRLSPCMASKVLPLPDLAKLAKKLKSKGKVVVQCHGTFDLMHPGHIKYFEEAKRAGDILIVTVTGDRFVRKGMGKPVFQEQIRADSVAALQCVDYVGIDPHETADEAITLIKPSLYVKGGEYEEKQDEAGHPTSREKKIVEKNGGHMYFTHDPVVFSSTALINEHFSAMPEAVRTFLHSMRFEYGEQDFINIVGKLRKPRVLVVGDAILDVYHYSNFLGRSVKEEIPRVRVIGTEMFAGGSLAVANTLAGFCDTVGVVTVLGKKDRMKEKRNERFIREHLKENVKPEFFYRTDGPTVVNERYVNNEPYLVSKSTKISMRKYFGLYHINEAPIATSLEKQLIADIKNIASRYDVVIVTDYGLGMMTPAVIQAVSKLPQFLAVNTQTNSMNYGFNMITKYPRADYISISLPEVRLALHDKQSDAEELTKRIKQAMQVKHVAITRGALGVLLTDKTGHTSIPALSTNVVDNIGGGDAYLALSALGIYLGFPRTISVFLGSVASALACGIIANKQTVDSTMLMKSVQSLLKSSMQSGGVTVEKKTRASSKKTSKKIAKKTKNTRSRRK